MPTLKSLRERALLSQGELAEALGVHPLTIHHWEHGHNQPRPAHQRKLAQIFNCSPDELLAALRETNEARERREQAEEKERPAA